MQASSKKQTKPQQKAKRLEVIESESDAGTDGRESVGASSCKTFVLFNEDHTLGNALRYIIMKNPQVQFCGYTVPHPLDNKIHFRIQTYGEVSAQDVFRKGLVDLKAVCAHIKTTFEAAADDPNFEDQVNSPTSSDVSN